MNPEAGDQQEAELLVRIAAGDRQALGELYDRRGGLLFALILRILNDPAEAEDILQEAFLQIWDKSSSYDPALGKPSSWIVAIARNKALDRLRAAQRRHELHEKAAQDARSDPASASDDPGRSERARLILASLNKLPEEQRQAIELAFFGGLTQTEIAEQLRIPLGTAKARIRRGMLKLRSDLEPCL